MEIVKVDNNNEIIINDDFEKELNEKFSSTDKNCIIYKSDFYTGHCIAAEKLNDKIIFCDSRFLASILNYKNSISHDTTARTFKNN